MIKFIVDTDGALTDIQPETSCGYGMEEEAMRVIRNSPKWKPAFQNGHTVKAIRQQPVTFRVDK